MLPDAIYTPTQLARQLVCSSKRGFVPRNVIDIAAGHGELLRAANEKWNGIITHAWDIDSRVTRKLRRLHPTWKVKTIDSASYIDEKFCSNNRFDLVLLNPPFSCRGGSFYTINVNTQSFPCSRAGLFLIKGLSLLEERGELLAILPSGILNNEKDSFLWRYINKFYRAKVVAENCPKAFPGLRIRTLIVRFTKRPYPLSLEILQTTNFSKEESEINLRRGTCPARLGHNGFAPGLYRLIHTTDINRDIIRKNNKRYVKWKWTISGPVVLIPRVGNPNNIKVACYYSRRKIAISDCIFAISCASNIEALSIARQIRRQWLDLKQLYKGTCAQFITQKILTEFLNRHIFANRRKIKPIS